MKERKFDHGGIVMTKAIADRAGECKEFGRFVDVCLIRHVCGDWGELCEEDVEMNEEALKSGGRLFSSYRFNPTEETIWIITEDDRSVTTILFPEDY